LGDWEIGNSVDWEIGRSVDQERPEKKFLYLFLGQEIGRLLNWVISRSGD
jgi:hypothetical protein